MALEAFNEGRQYALNIIERQLMRQDVAADGASAKAGLKESGHVEVPGIFFDFGKAEVKPESQRALTELTALLQNNAALKVWVVGHTDNFGATETNVSLSAARAAAVVKAKCNRRRPGAQPARGTGGSASAEQSPTQA